MGKRLRQNCSSSVVSRLLRTPLPLRDFEAVAQPPIAPVERWEPKKGRG